MENKDGFQFTYSAIEQEEIKAIRDKYSQPKQEEDKMTKLRRLDASVTRKATVASLVLGIIGSLILGTGMSFAMTDIGKAIGLKGDISFDACIDTVKSGKRHIDISAESHYCNKKDYANDKSSIEAYYLTQYKKAGYSFRGGNGDKDLTIHHIVEQSQAPKKFANADIQTDLNTVAISPKLHQLISDVYNTGPSKNADLLNKLFPGKFDLKAGGKLRNQIYNMSYEDQYEVGTRILEHFLSQATVDKEKTCLRVSKIK